MVKEIILTFHISSKREKVISALTHITQIQKWWTEDASGRNGKGIFRWKDRGWTVEMTIHKSKSNQIVRWICTKSNMQDTNAWEGSTVSFELNDKESGTTINFKHSDYKSSPCYEVCNAGWNFVIGKSLKSYLESGKGLPYTIN